MGNVVVGRVLVVGIVVVNDGIVVIWCVIGVNSGVWYVVGSVRGVIVVVGSVVGREVGIVSGLGLIVLNGIICCFCFFCFWVMLVLILNVVKVWLGKLMLVNLGCVMGWL